MEVEQTRISIDESFKSFNSDLLEEGQTEESQYAAPEFHEANQVGTEAINLHTQATTTQEPVIKRRTNNEKRSNHEEKVKRDKLKHVMRPSCPEPCKKKCSSLLVDADRVYIWENYWSLKYCDRRKWLAKNVQIVQIQRKTVTKAPAEHFLKADSRKFFLPKNNQSVCVCRRFFLNTLVYSNDSVITELCAAIKREPLLNNIRENRGISNPERALCRTVLINHINSYKPSVSHYRRHNAPNMRYVPRELTVKAMYSDFIVKHPGFCKLETYRTTLKSMHVSLRMPKSDVCVDCETYKISIA
ncbi:unnamed protein product [Psylliodes chrysocephalus]|uniref:Uncharacterized protein n=1 Tax=Psylliodes chrysocephalus TaxID=3402493 RepID=A0A9P0CY90_9CUCU|nr:unnamed protein product [Psylliodes chrysocephala]